MSRDLGQQLVNRKQGTQAFRSIAQKGLDTANKHAHELEVGSSLAEPSDGLQPWPAPCLQPSGRP